MQLSIIDWVNISVILLAGCGVAWLIAADIGSRSRIRRRLQVAAQGPHTDISALSDRSLRDRLVKTLSSIGKRLPVFNGSQRKEMRSKLVAAGYRQSGALPVLMGSAVTCGLLCTALVVVLVWPHIVAAGTTLQLIIAFAALYVGLLLPRMVLDKMVHARQEAISNSFPDALDLMVVCANAGLGMTATVQRVAQELEFLAPELSDEFNLTAAQLQVSGDVSKVLTDMAERIDMDSVRSLASTLTQSRQYGTPISEALRVLAASERTARRMRTEEAAGKLATKMTLPMMIFILPTVLLIVGGPAVLGLIQSFSRMGN